MNKISSLSFYPLFVLIQFLLMSGMSAQDSLVSSSVYSLDEIIVLSDKLDTKLNDVSTKVKVLTRDQIEAINGERLPEILRTSSNVFIKSYGLTPTLSTISLNGLGAEHTLIILDGVRLNSFQNSNIDLSLIPKDQIEKIEIINNGVSSIYGSDALGGVVNIELKNKENLAPRKSAKINASIAGGSFNTLGYSLGYYREYENLNARISFSRETSDGDYEYYNDNGKDKILKERENSAYSIYDIGLSTQYLINDGNIVKFVSTYSNQDKEVPGIENGTPSGLTKQIDQNWNNILTLDNKISDEINLKSNLNFQKNLMKYSIDPFLNSSYKNLVYSGGSEVRYKKSNYGITTGYNFIHAKLKSEDVISGVKRNQHAFFASTYYTPFNWIKIYPSGRYDYISDINEGTFTYKIGMNLQPFNESNIGIRGNIGKNFRAPSFNDLYWINSGNENLKSEYSLNMESGLFYSFVNFIKGRVELSYTYISAEDKIIWTPQSNGFWAPQNVAESVSNNYSVNFNAEKEISDDISIIMDTGIQLTNTKKTSSTFINDPTKNKYIPYIPLQAANVNIGFVYRNLAMNLFYSYSGKRYSDFANTQKMKEFSTVDGNISYGFNVFDFASKLRFEVNNMFNTEYEVISGYPMPLRYYKITFRINY